MGSGANPLFGWIREAAQRLATIDAGNPHLEAEYLMAHALRTSRMGLMMTDAPPSPASAALFEALLVRRLAREPLQYVLGSADFAGLDLEVGPGVFIPRSETEVLVEQVGARLRARSGGVATSVRILDVGTGTGAILLALLSRLPGAIGAGTDVSRAAVAFARRNAARLGLAHRAAWLLGDLLEPVRARRPLDAIVANPPYIASGEAASLAPEIREHEPPEALFAGEDGLDVIRRLIQQAADRLLPSGLLALEIGITQADAVLDLLSSPPWASPSVIPDLSGRPRVVLATRA